MHSFLKPYNKVTFKDGPYLRVCGCIQRKGVIRLGIYHIEANKDK